MTIRHGDIPSVHRDAIDQIQMDRGWIVSSYAQVELLMADAIVQVQNVSEYEHLPKTPPFNVTKRAKRFREIVEMPGPIALDRDLLLNVIDTWEATEEIRHFLVHGFAIFRFTEAGDMAMTFRRYMPDYDPIEPFREMHFRPATLTKIRHETTAAAAVAVAAFAIMHERMGWVGPADHPMRGNKA